MSDLDSKAQSAFRAGFNRPAKPPAVIVGAIAAAICVGYVGWTFVEGRSGESAATDAATSLDERAVSTTTAASFLEPIPTAQLTLDNADRTQGPAVINAHLEMPAGGYLNQADDVAPMVRQLGFRAVSEMPESAAWLTGTIESLSEPHGTLPVVSFPAGP